MSRSGQPSSTFTLAAAPRLNALRLVFDPQALRPHILGWPRLARELLMRVHRSASSPP